ncbi:hypothetical protein NPIL_547731 [Nephila pilipes]|uniref:Uncharacterized protein n=1 Tax=Nephila pilipes TaxID=299642 RepID=A0A8X6PT44_NEPPI|nr:hypothetical protein NPIL_547731 [Nephila pilipes]
MSTISVSLLYLSAFFVINDKEGNLFSKSRCAQFFEQHFHVRSVATSYIKINCKAGTNHLKVSLLLLALVTLVPGSDARNLCDAMGCSRALEDGSESEEGLLWRANCMGGTCGLLKRQEDESESCCPCNPSNDIQVLRICRQVNNQQSCIQACNQNMLACNQANNQQNCIQSCNQGLYNQACTQIVQACNPAYTPQRCNQGCNQNMQVCNQANNQQGCNQACNQNVQTCNTNCNQNVQVCNQACRQQRRYKRVCRLQCGLALIQPDIQTGSCQCRNRRSLRI